MEAGKTSNLHAHIPLNLRQEIDSIRREKGWNVKESITRILWAGVKVLKP